jgi:hypothetical protein
VPAANWVRDRTGASRPAIRRIWIASTAANGVTIPHENTMIASPRRTRPLCALYRRTTASMLNDGLGGGKNPAVANPMKNTSNATGPHAAQTI